ncbi:MAG: histidine kinase [Propioniciclava sp.]|uniref:sensor histidine kinase n=1 Tax=Propioniciclava sp. TaxID=2038686 RepID=UPI0039E61358
MTVTDPLAAPGFLPEAAGLPWWRRALAQGGGYLAPSTLFAGIPLLFAGGLPPWQLALLAASCLAVAVIFLGTCLVMHWSEAARWCWLLALMLAIIATGVAGGEIARPLYFAPYIATAASVLLAWSQARIVIIVVSVAIAGLAVFEGDLLGVVMALVALTVGLTIGLSLESDRAKRALRLAEERTAVLAVAAERERIGRDLHDILGHSLTSIAVKADLAARLIGRNDEAARAEVSALADITRRALADVRATAAGMRTVRLTSEIAAARSVLEAAGLEARTPSAVPALDDDRSELFGYAVREAVTNVVRHAGAHLCVIVCDEARVSIADDGVGFRSDAAGSGLTGLRERVEAAGGRLSVESSGSGSVLTVEMEAPS